jgi:hypothetical protein
MLFQMFFVRKHSIAIIAYWLLLAILFSLE